MADFQFPGDSVALIGKHLSEEECLRHAKVRLNRRRRDEQWVTTVIWLTITLVGAIGLLLLWLAVSFSRYTVLDVLYSGYDISASLVFSVLGLGTLCLVWPARITAKILAERAAQARNEKVERAIAALSWSPTDALVGEAFKRWASAKATVGYWAPLAGGGMALYCPLGLGLTKPPERSIYVVRRESIREVRLDIQKLQRISETKIAGTIQGRSGAALIGALVAGPSGAVVGGSASRSLKADVTTTETAIYNWGVDLYTTIPEMPYLRLPFCSEVEAKHFYAVILLQDNSNSVNLR